MSGGAEVSSASLVIERVIRPLRRPWLLAVRRPLIATGGSLSSASSPEVSSLYLENVNRVSKRMHRVAEWSGLLNGTLISGQHCEALIIVF